MSITNFLRHLSIRLRSINATQISPEEYAQCYRSWGGSFIVHPEVLQFFEAMYGVKTIFRGYFNEGKCIAAVGTWGSYLAGDRNALRIHGLTDRVDFGYPVVYLPIAPECSCRLLYRTGYLLGTQRQRIGWAVFPKLKKMSILKQIPDGLPTGKKEYQIKERRFERLGGVARNIQEFRNDEIVAIYAELFRIRWQRSPLALDSLSRTLDYLRQFLFGKVLLLKNRPVAIQINYRAETSPAICIDYVNGGVDKAFAGISPGSLLSYFNGRDACAEAKGKGKQLIYSYGKANTDYKDQWCNRIDRGFAGFWIP